jgi:hypothetical protein
MAKAGEKKPAPALGIVCGEPADQIRLILVFLVISILVIIVNGFPFFHLIITE